MLNAHCGRQVWWGMQAAILHRGSSVCSLQSLVPFLLLSSQLRRWAGNARHSSSTPELLLLLQQPQRENNLPSAWAVWVKKVRNHTGYSPLENRLSFSFSEIALIKLQFLWNIYWSKIHICSYSSNTFLNFTGENENLLNVLFYFNFWGLCFAMIFP